MSIELKVPEVGESVREVEIGCWLKGEGDFVEQDENLVELETDKASMELPAPVAGVIGKILKRAGELVAVGEVIGYIEEGSAGSKNKGDAASNKSTKAKTQKEAASASGSATPSSKDRTLSSKTAASGMSATTQTATLPDDKVDSRLDGLPVTPAARRELRAHGLAATDIETSSVRIDRDEVLQYVKELKKVPQVKKEPDGVGALVKSHSDVELAEGELEEVVPMSLIRRRIAERLVQAQHQAALLTTFNEIDLSAVKEIRSEYRDLFLKKYGVKLGFTSFFVKAVVDALKEQPGLNAEIRDKQIAYRQFYHIGIAIGSNKGLVVPVLRFADRLSFAEIELAVEDFAQRANGNKLEPRELQGGTFTITNGGVFGSLLSTPIVNPPQSGVLGMHMIQDRPVARNGQVVIRPMMYVALTYDHRLVDGREAVTFLTRIKEAIEEPSRMLVEI